MSDVENGFNVISFRNWLINYLINYLTEYKNKNNRRTTTLRLDPQVYYEFLDSCRIFGVYPFHGTNVIVEALMKLFIDQFGNKPRFIQTTLFYKPTINIQKTQINIATKLEVKLVRNELQHILIALEQGKASDFWLSKLRETIPKAIRIYDKTRDSELEELLKKSEKWIEKIYRRNF